MIHLFSISSFNRAETPLNVTKQQLSNTTQHPFSIVDCAHRRVELSCTRANCKRAIFFYACIFSPEGASYFLDGAGLGVVGRYAIGVRRHTYYFIIRKTLNSLSQGMPDSLTQKSFSLVWSFVVLIN